MSKEIQKESYKKGLDVDFKKIYNEALDGILNQFFPNQDLIKDLREKRERAIDKYGKHSFQYSFNTAINANIKEHLKEEIVDGINYALHGYWENSIKGNVKKVKCYEEIIENLIETYRYMSLHM